MSIYIKGMEMPISCDDCFLPLRYCPYAMKPDGSCPLVSVPEHGDLIDRNKLYEKTAEWEAQALHMVEVTMNDEDTTEWRKWSTVLAERSAFKFDVADAPAIIPADKETYNDII